MAAKLNPNEEAQLLQTIEMFEVIAESQPNDYQSLEILKEAYSKLGRTENVIKASRRIAKAYEDAGQIFSAILEYESILELNPDDREVKAALASIVSKGETFAGRGSTPEPEPLPKTRQESARPETAIPRAVRTSVDDGREAMRKLYVDGKLLNPVDFDTTWFTPDPNTSPMDVQVPFIQNLSDKSLVPLEQSLKLLHDKTRLCYLSMDRYEIDMDWLRKFPEGLRSVCYRWCVLPFDHMSKSTLVATANPFNQQAVEDLAELGHSRLIWYLAAPVELLRLIKKAVR